MDNLMVAHCDTLDVAYRKRGLKLLAECGQFTLLDVSAEELAFAAALGDDDFDAYVASKFTAAGPDDCPF